MSADENKIESKRREFCKMLLKLSGSQDILKDYGTRHEIYLELEMIYSDNFRHYYSDIFIVLSLIERGPSDKYSIDILGQNMATILNDYTKHHYDIKENLRKLYDHINLDIARIKFSQSEDLKSLGIEQQKKFKKQADAIQTECDLIKNEQEQMTQKLNNVQREYVAVLGIFASIALAFVGGLAFSTSVLENIGNVSKYRLFAAIGAIGLVFINIIYGMLYYIGKIVDKKVSCKPWIIIDIVLSVSVIGVAISWLICEKQ